MATGSLGETKGLGVALTEKITTLWTAGSLDYHQNLLASVPVGLLEMLEIPGLGGKKIKALNENLGVETIGQLRQAYGKVDTHPKNQ